MPKSKRLHQIPSNIPQKDAKSVTKTTTIYWYTLFTVLFVISPLFLYSIESSAQIEAWSFVILPPLAVFVIVQFREELNRNLLSLLLTWLVCVFLFGLVGEYPFLSIVETLRFTCIFCVFLLVNVASSAINKENLLTLTAVSGVLPSIFGFYLLLGRGGVTTDFSGMTGTFGLHNPFAGYLLMTIPVSMYIAYNYRNDKRFRLLWFASLLIQIAAFILTKSRASLLIAIFIGILAVFVLLLKKHGKLTVRFTKVIGYTLLASGVLFATVFPDVLFKFVPQMYNNFDYSFKGRLAFWNGGMRIFLDNPLGTGANTFANAFTRYQEDYMYYSTDPHSFVVSTLQGQGIIGIILLLVLLWRIVNVAAFRIVNEKDSVMLAIIAAIAACALHSTVDFDMTFSANAWLFIALTTLVASTSPNTMVQTEELIAVKRTYLAQKLTRQATVIVLIAMWFVGVLIAGVPWLNLEARAGDHNEVSDFALNAVFPYAPFYLRRLNEITQGDLNTSERNVEVQNLHDKLVNFNRANNMVASGFYLQAITNEMLGLDGIDILYLRAIELDPHNHPEYYFSLTRYQDRNKDDQSLYRTLNDFLIKNIAVNEPIKPDHYRPTWIGMNTEFAYSWHRLAELEARFGTIEKAIIYEETARKFDVYLEQTQ